MAQESNLYQAYKLAYRDRTLFLKNSILAIAIIVCFVLGSVFFLSFLNDFSRTNLVLAILFWLIGFSLMPIFFLVIPIQSFLLWNLAISVSPFLPLLFKNQLNLYLFIIAGFVFLSFFVSRASIKGESNNLLDLKLMRIISKGSFFLLLILVVILSTLVYFQGKPGQIEQSSEQALDTVLSRSEGAQNAFGLQLTGTVDDILKNYIQKQVLNLGDAEQEMIIDNESFLTQTKSSLSNFLNIPLTGKEKLSSLIVDWIKARWQTSSPLLRISLFLVIFLLVLSLLRFINIIFSFILFLSSWSLLQILVSVKYLAIKRIDIEKREIKIA